MIESENLSEGESSSSIVDRIYNLNANVVKIIRLANGATKLDRPRIAINNESIFRMGFMSKHGFLEHIFSLKKLDLLGFEQVLSWMSNDVFFDMHRQGRNADGRLFMYCYINYKNGRQYINFYTTESLSELVELAPFQIYKYELSLEGLFNEAIK